MGDEGEQSKREAQGGVLEQGHWIQVLDTVGRDSPQEVIFFSPTFKELLTNIFVYIESV